MAPRLLIRRHTVARSLLGSDGTRYTRSSHRPAGSARVGSLLVLSLLAVLLPAGSLAVSLAGTHAIVPGQVPRMTTTGQWERMTQCSLTEPRSMPANVVSW